MPSRRRSGIGCDKVGFMMTAPDGLRLNLGSGARATPGWVCIDRSPNIILSRHVRLKAILYRLRLLRVGHMEPWDRQVVRGDIRSLKFGDGSVAAVYSSHVLEHLYFEDAKRVLAEIRRVLKPGGVLRLALPNAVEHARELVEREYSRDSGAGLDYNRRLLAHPECKPKGLSAFVGRAGAHTHYWQPTPSLVIEMVTAAGFSRARMCEFGQGDLPGVRQVETRADGFHMECIAGDPGERAASPGPM